MSNNLFISLQWIASLTGIVLSTFVLAGHISKETRRYYIILLSISVTMCAGSVVLPTLHTFVNNIIWTLICLIMIFGVNVPKRYLNEKVFIISLILLYSSYIPLANSIDNYNLINHFGWVGIYMAFSAYFLYTLRRIGEGRYHSYLVLFGTIYLLVNIQNENLPNGLLVWVNMCVSLYTLGKVIRRRNTPEFY